MVKRQPYPTICQARDCSKAIPVNGGRGRKRRYCSERCKVRENVKRHRERQPTHAHQGKEDQ